MPHSIPFFLITGFLGSGKTTLLKRILNAHADSRKVAVIQNEFAPASVDGRELKDTGKSFEILEINRGSVFCVCLLSDFVRSLGDFVRQCRPDAVVLEATGLADPIAVAQLLHASTLRDKLHLAHVWCIVDASSFMCLEKANTRVVHQVRIADTIVLNKIDKKPGAKKRIRARLAALNPFSDIVATSYCEFDLSKIFSPSVDSPVAVLREHDNASFESCGRPDVHSAVIRTTTRIAEGSLERFLVSEATDTYRLKGYVVLSDGRTVGVQSCFGESCIEPVEGYVGPTELVAMGPGLEPKAFSVSFEKYARETV